MKNAFGFFLFILFASNSFAGGRGQGYSGWVRFDRIVSQGVPADALDRLFRFIDANLEREFRQDIYVCDGQDPENVKPCETKKRRAAMRTVRFQMPEYVAIVDYGQRSVQRRFHLIHLPSGDVRSFYAAHGIGSGAGDWAYKFSNTQDSKQSSLGIYLAGPAYRGAYGAALRLYGLEASNDQAYVRDIVVHGAWYVGEDFINSLNPKTGLPFGRLGLSWGCPALSLSMAKKIIPLLADGGLIMHYHSGLQDAAQSGREVVGVVP